MTDDIGNSAQVRKVAQQLLDAYGEMAPREAPIHPLVKWLVGAIAAFGSAAMLGLGIWLISSVSMMRETLARMDERQVISSQALADRFQTIDERLSRLETQKEAKR